MICASAHCNVPTNTNNNMIMCTYNSNIPWFQRLVFKQATMSIMSVMVSPPATKKFMQSPLHGYGNNDIIVSVFTIMHCNITSPLHTLYSIYILCAVNACSPPPLPLSCCSRFSCCSVCCCCCSSSYPLLDSGGCEMNQLFSCL